MLARRMFTRYAKYQKLDALIYSSKTFNAIYDKNIDYFRSRNEFKNSVVHFHNELDQSSFIGPGWTFIQREQTEEYFAHLGERKNVMKLSPQEVRDVLLLMANIKVDTVQYSAILRYLDEKCAVNATKWPLDLSLFVLDAWFIIWGQKAFVKHSYSAITSLWGMKIKRCTKSNLILMLYFLGMGKDLPPFFMELIEIKMESCIDKFTDEELAIAGLSFFKTQKRLESKIMLEKFCQAAENLLQKNDWFNVISILKCLRLSKYYDSKLWSTIKESVIRQSCTFNFVDCTNFLAMFAAENIYDEELFDILEERGLSTLMYEKTTLEQLAHELNTVLSIESRPSLQTDIENIACFVRSMCSVGHSIKKNTLDFMNAVMMEKNKGDQLDTPIHILADYLKSLALVGCYPHNTLQSLLNKKTLKKIYYTNRVKLKHQLHFVRRGSQIEEPELEINMKNLFKPIPRSIARDLRKRKGFQDMVDMLKNIPNVYVKICYLLPHIMISGIIVGTKLNDPTENIEKAFELHQKYLDAGILSKHAKDIFQKDRDYLCVEVLDSTVCVRESTLPLGLMKTKIRQLEKLNFKVVTLSPENIGDLVKKNISEKCDDINKLLKIN